MAERTLLLTLRVIVSDLSDEERQRHADEMCLDSPDEIERIAEVEPGIIGVEIADSLPVEQVQDIIWEGSDTFAKITHAEPVSAQWVE